MARRPSRTLLSPGPLVLVLILFPMYRPLLFILLLKHKPLVLPLTHKPLVYSPGPGARGIWPRKPFFLQRYYDRLNEMKRCGNASSSSGVQGPGRVVPLDAEPWIMVDLTEDDDED